MNRRGVGTVFIVTAALLFALRYILAALLMPSNSGWNSDYYEMVLKEAGVPLLTLSILFLIAGLIYFILGDFKKGVRWYTDQVKGNWFEEQEHHRVEELKTASEQEEKPTIS